MRQLDRVLLLLETLAERGDVPLGDLALALGVPRATVHRLLVGLKERGYVEHDGSARVYRVGPALRALSTRSTLSALVRLVEPALLDLRAATGETVNLGVLSGGQITYQATLDGVHVPRMSSRVGEQVPAHSTAIGKAILMTLPEDERKSLLGPSPYERTTPRTISDPRTLARELALSTRRGYALDDEESVVGAVCVGVPIVGRDGRAVGALSVSGIGARLPETEQRRVARLLTQWSERISGELWPASAEPVAEKSR